MGAFELIEKQQFRDFCNLYETCVHLRSDKAEYQDLIPGNYILALLGVKNYDRLVEFCLEEINKELNSKSKLDRRSSYLYIACSIGYFELQEYEKALEMITEACSVPYQDISRTQAPCVIYYEAVMLNDKKAIQFAKRLLNARVRKVQTIPRELAIASFLVDKCSREEMLAQIDTFPPVLRERHLVRALFYIAVKELERGNTEQSRRYFSELRSLYDGCHAVTMSYEFYLAENCLSKPNNSSVL